MQITEVRIHREKPCEKCGRNDEGGAHASVTFDDVLVVRDFQVKPRGEEGAVVTFPYRRDTTDDKYYDTVFVLSREFRQMVEERILAEYNAQDS